MRDIFYLNYDWIYRCDGEETKVDIPHTFVETPFNYFDESIYQKNAEYIKAIEVPIEWQEMNVTITFDGIAHSHELYINGKYVGEHHSGYTAKSYEINDVLLYGETNIIEVKVNSKEDQNIPPFGHVVDYMTYGGMYREAYITIKNKTFIRDVFAYSEIDVSKEEAILHTEIEIENNDDKMCFLRQILISKSTNEERFLGDKEADIIVESKYLIDDIKLWDVSNPVLYDIKASLYDEEGNILDEIVTTIGFRKAEFKEDGFYLNDKKLKIRGLNRHQSYPYVGYAMPQKMQEEDAIILKYELGLNAVRTSHYPQSHHFINMCDKLGLLVFTEIPGWQYIGDEEWKEQAISNVRDMILQYRNHTSIVLWGVRINESKDDDMFYIKTNKTAHALDPSRPTGGVRCIKNSNLFEDVYTYNDFVHDGKKVGVEPKRKVTSDNEKPYLVSEYNGHMFPTKSFDCEEKRLEHALRHVRVLDEVYKQEDIAGSFGWCMFDYNTHKDFGSGDRICYHGVMDMFRNPKLAASVYASQQDTNPFLEISSSMDIGEHPECNRGNIYIFSNADSVRMYKNDKFIKEYDMKETEYTNMPHGAVRVDDFIGDAIADSGRFKPKQAKLIKDIMNETALYGMNNLPKRTYLKALKLILFYHMKPNDAVELYNTFIGDWGGKATEYKFEAVKDGEVIGTIVKTPMTEVKLMTIVSSNFLIENETYDVASVRINAVDENDNILPYFDGVCSLETEGDIEIIGPKAVSLKGGMAGTYVKTTGKSGKGKLIINNDQTNPIEIKFVTKKV